MLKISEDVMEREIFETINFYDEKLIFSGFSLQNRVQVIERGIADYRERLMRIKSCRGNPHLRSDQTLLERTRKRLIEQVTWYKGWDQAKRSALTEGLSQTVQLASRQGGKVKMKAATSGSNKLEVITAVFVARTTDGELLKLMRAAESKLSEMTGYKIKIVEKNGITLGQSLVQRDPFIGWPCGRECGVCKWKPLENSK